MISPTEALILSLLLNRSDGAFASELMHLSEGKLKRGSVYTILGRMELAGLVSSKEEPATEAYAMPRTIYRITGNGISARNEFGNWTGLIPAGGVL